MNDEIKQILIQLEYFIEEGYEYYNDIKLNKNQMKQLLDYITNLQQELQEANDSVEWWSNRYNAVVKNCDETIKKMIALGEENERLKEENNNKAMNDYAHAIDESWYRELYDDYKSRCEKAIEYINKNKHLSMFADCREPEEDWNYDLECSANDLLNILQNGSDSQ